MGCIFGYFGVFQQGLIERMASILSHRCKNGWETSSVQSGPELTVEIGHGIAPWNQSPKIAISSPYGAIFGYSGVIFNKDKLFQGNQVNVEQSDIQPGQWLMKDGRRLKNTGQSTPHTSATSDLLSMLISNGDSVIEALEGAFVGAFAKGTAIYLFRDPAGMKALYWARTPKRLLFASEVKALFADAEVSKELRTAAVAEYLTFSFTPGPGTMFKWVNELQPGSILKLQGNNLSINRHFRFEEFEWDKSQPLSKDHHISQLRNDLELSVKECFIGKQAPGVFLSGGIDSSAVLAIAANQRPDIRLRTYSVHFGDRYVNENEFVDQMIRKYNTRHRWLEIKPKKFLKELRDIIWKLDEPIGDPITVPNFLLAKAASEEIDLVLNGEGGDPCFGGPKNLPMMLSAMYGPGLNKSSNGWLERQYLRSYRKCYSDLPLIMTPDAFRDSGGYESLTNIITPFLETNQPKDFLNKLMSINIRLKGANLILIKVDKMTSANGVLALAPLFSKRAIIASMTCPPKLKLNGNIEKNILKQAVKDIVPEAIINRPKSGMMVPVRFWLQGEMKRYAKKALSKRKLKSIGLFDHNYVRKILNYDRMDVQGARHGLKLWMLITFTLWYERMIGDPS